MLGLSCVLSCLPVLHKLNQVFLVINGQLRKEGAAFVRQGESAGYFTEFLEFAQEVRLLLLQVATKHG